MLKFLLNILSFGAILSSVLVITSKNPVIAVIFLILLFVNISSYLLLLGLGFIGISYIIIYIGAITVLFLFIIMMINIRLVDILEVGKEYTKNLPLALLVGGLFVFEIFKVLPYTINNIFIFNLPINTLNMLNSFLLNINNFTYFNNLLKIFYNLFPLGASDTFINNFLQIEVLGQGIYTYGAIWILICSIILLLAMLSAIILSGHLK